MIPQKMHFDGVIFKVPFFGYQEKAKKTVSKLVYAQYCCPTKRRFNKGVRKTDYLQHYFEDPKYEGKKMSLSTLIEIDRSLEDLVTEKHYKAIKSKVLFMIGSGDSVVNNEDARRIFDEMGCEKHWIEYVNIDHNIFAESEYLNEVVNDMATFILSPSE